MSLGQAPALVHNRTIWENQQVIPVTKEELDAAEKRRNGWICSRAGIDLYLDRTIIIGNDALAPPKRI